MGVGSELIDEVFKLQDGDGRLLALRAEATTPVARLYTASIKDRGLPARLFYIVPCLRYVPLRDVGLREFRQAGAELIGDPSVAADAEVIALMVACLEEAGIRGVRVDVGSVRLLRRIASALGMERSSFVRFRRAVMRRDLEEAKEVLNESGANDYLKKALLELPFVRGDLSDIRKYAEKLHDVEQEVRSFEEALDLLRSYGYSSRITFDLSVVREFEYYTGLVFEAYAPGMGVTIGAGGRYDDLLREMGIENPSATGFAICVDLCVEVMERQGVGLPAPRTVAYVGVCQGVGVEQAVALARKLRELGVPVALSLDVKEMDDLRRFQSAFSVIFAVGKEISVLSNGGWRKVEVEEALELSLRAVRS